MDEPRETTTTTSERDAMTAPLITKLTGVVTAAVLLSSLAACSDDAKESSSASAQKSSRASDSPSRSQRISPTDLPTAPALNREKGAVKDVTVGSCPADKGSNTVKGEVTNPTAAAKDYVITISWITSRSDVVARGIATVKDLGAGKSRSWKATGDIATSGSYSCTTQVLRGQLKGS